MRDRAAGKVERGGVRVGRLPGSRSRGVRRGLHGGAGIARQDPRRAGLDLPEQRVVARGRGCVRLRHRARRAAKGAGVAGERQCLHAEPFDRWWRAGRRYGRPAPSTRMRLVEGLLALGHLPALPALSGRARVRGTSSRHAARKGTARARRSASGWGLRRRRSIDPGDISRERVRQPLHRLLRVLDAAQAVSDAFAFSPPSCGLGSR